MIGFIQNLIAKQKHLEAVEYAYAFELTGHFQPIPILKDYLKQVMQISECVCIGETCSVKEKVFYHICHFSYNILLDRSFL